MADTLEIFGTEYTGVAGIIATTPNETDLTYIRPQGTKSITQNGSGIDVVNYASVDVNVSGGQPNLQSKTKTYTPTTSQQTESVTADSGYDGLDAVNVTVNAMPTGTAGTPAITVGALARGERKISASVTNTAGYIDGGTLDADAVYLDATSFASGSRTITENGTFDVTGYESANVIIPFVTYYTGTSDPSSSLGSNGDIYLKVVS